jgi:phage terminase Nu1 subunit (DNA packaging protein)
MPKTNHTTLTDAQLDARRQNAAKAAEGRRQAVAARRAEKAAQVVDAGVPPFAVSEARLMAAKAGIAELEFAEKRGELVTVEEAEAHWIDTVTMIKTKILGVPARVAQRLPRLALEVVPVLDALLRESLEEIAASDGDAMDE